MEGANRSRLRHWRVAGMESPGSSLSRGQVEAREKGRLLCLAVEVFTTPSSLLPMQSRDGTDEG